MYKKISRSMHFLCIFSISLTAIMILSAVYSGFNSRIKTVLKNQAVMLSDILNTCDDKLSLLSGINGTSSDMRITLVAPDGTVLFDTFADPKTLKNHAERPEIATAMAQGTGEATRFSVNTSSTVSYYAIRLSDGNILRLADVTNSVRHMFAIIALPVLFISALLYLLCVLISAILTDNITDPINNINLSDINNQDYTNVYSEIVPFMDKIRAQNNEIERQMLKLKERKNRFEIISENISEGLVTLDSDGNVLSINKGAADIFGVEASKVLHKSFWHCSDSPVLAECFKKAISGEKNSVIISIGKKSYNIFYSPVFKEHSVNGILMLIFNITEKLEAEQSRREFTANVSHELKTPLTTILGYSQIINAGLAKPEDITRFTAKIENESTRLINLIDDIIKLSRLDEQSAPPDMQKISMLSTITDVSEQLTQKAAERGISINISGEDFKITANPLQISELIYNLVENAIKYNKESGNVHISLSERSFSVSDTGIGIPSEFSDRIFERFFRIDKSRSKSVNGTGLGLSIVKHIAELNNAKISLKSVPGEGSTFTVSFKD
ncbi:MAG: ATP-binding protein [Firmicutes bacterium]|nr:ATP-binding protein [Bacillota bacterium]